MTLNQKRQKIIPSFCLPQRLQFIFRLHTFLNIKKNLIVINHFVALSQNNTQCIGQRSGIVLNVADTVTSIALVLEFQLIHEAITIVGHGSNDMASDDLEKIVVVCCFDPQSSLFASVSCPTLLFIFIPGFVPH